MSEFERIARHIYNIKLRMIIILFSLKGRVKCDAGLLRKQF